MAATGRLSFRMGQVLDQRASVTGGTVKLDGRMGNVKTVLQFVLDGVQQLTALSVIGRRYFNMGRQGKDM